MLRLLIASIAKMIGHNPPVDIDFSGDDSDGLEPEGINGSKAEKFKELSDTQLDDDIEKYEGYVQKSTGLKLPDNGAKFTKFLQMLKNEKESRRIKRSLAVRFFPGGFSGV